jgi:hypothetical protein
VASETVFLRLIDKELVLDGVSDGDPVVLQLPDDSLFVGVAPRGDPVNVTVVEHRSFEPVSDLF